mmetsp:Transcript_17785/g.28987  ORF Transcript_17785/g.28987 Transcript_17785/m.28987 type:complete len:121 (+) Transcript_17785:76-438(+)|eukprot:CAMPEP_0169114552 /NCGR_PEP_ID=MMETSP1015-20121227/28818_1 /TAXON_ID=342587 /ORGANISM="Karlodinium micrum, Strain CCMP2283" /LENGTH=120 /DNA_ID=CAMNT_0009176841 /DNA_START=62 /DNA_END=424 /DNA_ORIENTATION=+
MSGRTSSCLIVALSMVVHANSDSALQAKEVVGISSGDQASPLAASSQFAQVAPVAPVANERKGYVGTAGGTYHHQGVQGTTIAWSMIIVYTSLTVMAFVMFCAWGDERHKQKSKPLYGGP